MRINTSQGSGRKKGRKTIQLWTINQPDERIMYDVNVAGSKVTKKYQIISSGHPCGHRPVAPQNLRFLISPNLTIPIGAKFGEFFIQSANILEGH